MKEYFSLILIFLLPVLQLLIIQRCITTLLGSGNRKPIGMISWLLYYVFLVTTGVEDLFPPQCQEFPISGSSYHAASASASWKYSHGVYDQHCYQKKESEKVLYQHPSYLYSMDGGRSHSVTYPRGGRYGRMRH